MKLNKCPKCGGKAVMTWRQDGNRIDYYAHCAKYCNDEIYKTTPQGAADAWNGVRRVRKTAWMQQTSLKQFGNKSFPLHLFPNGAQGYVKVTVEWTVKKGTK